MKGIIASSLLFTNDTSKLCTLSRLLLLLYIVIHSDSDAIAIAPCLKSVTKERVIQIHHVASIACQDQASDCIAVDTVQEFFRKD